MSFSYSRSSFRIAFIYLLVSSIWIFYSDKFLFQIFHDSELITLYQTQKGIVFVIGTTILIYYLVKREISRRNRLIQMLNEIEERYKTFINETTDGIYRIDLKEPVDFSLSPEDQVETIIQNAFIAECNEAAAHFYGLSSKEMLVGMPAVDISNLWERKKLKNLVMNFIRSSYRIKNMKIEVPEINGDDFPKNYLSTFVGIKENNFLNRVWIIQKDISERVYYEQKLIEARKIAEENSRLKTSFLANMSHEIRTPMNGVLGFSDLLSSKDITPEQRDNYINVIKTSGNQLLRIINDILDIAKIETGQLKLIREEFNLYELLRDIKLYFENLIKEKNLPIDFRFNICVQENFEFYSDKDRIYQVISNLLGNAVKFTQEGYIECSCRLSGEMLNFYVKDTGVGVPEEKQQRVFERFEQVEESKTKHYGGSGLGLAIARGIIEKLGGKIWFESKVGEGSTFYFNLPLNPVNSLKENLSGKKLVLLEGDYDSYELIQEFIAIFDVDLVWLKNLTDCLNFFDYGSYFDLFITDLRLPDGSGWEAVEKLQQIYNNKFIITLSAHYMEKDKAKLVEYNICGSLEKPIDLDAFKGILETCFINS